MSVEVCTVWAPRPSSAQWRDDYVRMMYLQKLTVEHFGHKHTVVTDGDDLPGFNCLRVRDMPESIMHAMIDGIIARLHEPVNEDIVFVDADVLANRNLEPAFEAGFDLGLTRRLNEKAPINNGAMYMAKHARVEALRFFSRALDVCGEHWGGDQEAISRVAAPVPERDCMKIRNGLRLGFLNMRTYSVVPKTPGFEHYEVPRPFMVHFKGSVAKEWMQEYAERFILKRPVSWELATS